MASLGVELDALVAGAYLDMLAGTPTSGA
jgi:hypothetical protein